MADKIQSQTWRLINTASSELCGDYEKLSPKASPTPRLIARVLVTTAFICIILLALALISTRASQVTTVRYFGKEFLEKSLRTIDANIAQISCPCKVSSTKWTNYTSFYLMNNSSKGNNIEVSEDLINSTCSKMGWKTNKKACPNVMKYCFGMMNQDLLSQQLLMPTVFHRTLGVAMQDSCTSQQRYYKLLLRTEALENNITGPRVEVQECRSEECKLEPLTRSLFAMHKAYRVNPNNNTDEYFWEAPSQYYPVDPTLFSNSGIAFKLTASWSNYMQACDPFYCDVVVQISLKRRLYLAVAQLGGLISIMVAGVRVFVWPFMVWTCGWDRHPIVNASKDIEANVEVCGSCGRPDLRRKHLGLVPSSPCRSPEPLLAYSWHQERPNSGFG